MDNRFYRDKRLKKQEKQYRQKCIKKRKNDKNRQQTTAVVYKCELYTQEKIKMWITLVFCIVEKVKNCARPTENKGKERKKLWINKQKQQNKYS